MQNMGTVIEPCCSRIEEEDTDAEVIIRARHEVQNLSMLCNVWCEVLEDVHGHESIQKLSSCANMLICFEP
jgi:hypothetical protein